MAFAIYYVVEAVHVSGVLAPVACSGAVGRRRLVFAADMRPEGGTAWKFVDFLLISLVFTLIGVARQSGALVQRQSYCLTWNVPLRTP
jgi:NhaP-type Na+/H+ or K+/H+ antiporter